MIAYHFPPLAGSSGIQRTLRFAQHLPAFGWQPLILSAHPRAYERTSDDLMAEIPEGMVVRRAFALDTSRHLAIRGRYIGALARPDRWMTWRFDALRQGLQMVRQYQPQVLWSTYPIATAHVIGAELARLTGVPWIADFRDPMAQEGYPADPSTWHQYRLIEERALAQSCAPTFTTPGAAAEYRRRYPAHAHKVQVIENGYDEESFAAIDTAQPARPLVEGAVTLLHSGIVYPSERDPTHLMAALRQLHDAGAITPQRLRVRFRAAVAEDLLHDLAARSGVANYVEVCPPIPYREALAEMLRADALLVMQASNCNAQIPAKLYEYLRAGRPILCLTDPAGDTAGVLRAVGIDSLARLDATKEIASLVQAFLSPEGNSLKCVPVPAATCSASRLMRTERLAALLDTTTPISARAH
jgi:glycosyltransferase involved in cell wall biosynthesis